MVGKTIGHYRVLEKLGEGGMGVVYLADDTTLNRKVALKVLPAELAQNQERLERFQREAKTAARLDHPNVVRVHDAGRRAVAQQGSRISLNGADVEPEALDVEALYAKAAP